MVTTWVAGRVRHRNLPAGLRLSVASRICAGQLGTGRRSTLTTPSRIPASVVTRMSTSTSAGAGDVGGVDKTIYKLTFYVPLANTEDCLAAVHATGAGTWPNPPGEEENAPPKYTHTAFVSRGTGQFKPAAGATPHVGEAGRVEHVEEDRVEMVVVGEPTVRAAVASLRQSHPYEVVAYFVVKCEDY